MVSHCAITTELLNWFSEGSECPNDHDLMLHCTRCALRGQDFLAQLLCLHNAVQSRLSSASFWLRCTDIRLLGRWFCWSNTGGRQTNQLALMLQLTATAHSTDQPDASCNETYPETLLQSSSPCSHNTQWFIFNSVDQLKAHGTASQGDNPVSVVHA